MITSNNLKPIFISIICATVLASSANAAWSGGGCNSDGCTISNEVKVKVSTSSGSNQKLTIDENGSINTTQYAVEVTGANTSVENITNNGSLISNNTRTILIQNASVTNIINNKNIANTNNVKKGIAILFENAKVDNFTNNGKITATNANANGFYLYKNSTLNKFINSGTIKSNVTAFRADSGTSFKNFDNSGTLSANANSAVLVNTSVELDDFKNSGKVTSTTSNAIAFNNDTIIKKFTNDTNGVISGSNNSAAITFGSSSTSANTTIIDNFINKGKIENSKFGITLWGKGEANSKITNFKNEGSINTTNDSLYFLNTSIDNFLNDKNATISSNTIGFSFYANFSSNISLKNFTNNGTINATNNNAINIQTLKPFSGEIVVGDIVNNGNINAKRGAYIGLWHGDGKLIANSFINNGNVNASVQDGISLEGKGVEVSLNKLENNGTITSKGNSITITNSVKVGEIINNGTLESQAKAIHASGVKIDKIVNKGDILGNKAGGGLIYYSNHGIGLQWTTVGSVESYGNISAYVGVFTNQASIGKFNNYGVIESTGSNNPRIGALTLTGWNGASSVTKIGELNNYGSLISQTHGISVEHGNRAEVFNNYGKIEAQASGIYQIVTSSDKPNGGFGEINLKNGSSIVAQNNGIDFQGKHGYIGELNVEENALLQGVNGNGIILGNNNANQENIINGINLQGSILGNEENGAGILIAGNGKIGSDGKDAINLNGGTIAGANSVINNGSIVSDINLSNNSSLVGNFINASNSSIEGNINIDNSKLDGSLVFSDSAKIQGDISLNNNSSISKDLITSDNSSINGRIDINNSSLDNIISAGSSTINGKINVTNNSKINNINFENDAILRGDISVNEGSKLASISTNNNSSIDGDIKISSNAKLDKIINKSTNKNAINGSIINKQNNALEIVNDNNSSINGGIVNEGSSVISITNKGHIGKNDDGFNVSNNKNGSIVIKDWQVNADSSGKLESINIGGNTNKVYVDKITVNQSGMDITKLDNLSQVINGVDISKIGSIQTAGSDLELTINPITNKLQAKPEVVKTIASAQVQSLVETTSKRTTFANSLMSNIMQDYTMPTNINTQRISLKDLENLRFASAGNIVSDVSYDYLMRYVGADSAFLNQMKLDYISNKKRNSIFILPYHSYQYVDLGAQGVSKGHTTGVIAGYSRASTYGIFGVYAGYEDVRMSTGYYEVNNIAYYAGLKYYNDIYSLSDNSSLYVKTHAKFAYLNNSLVKYIAANTAKANPTSYTYGLSADLGINYEYKKHSFSPEIGLDYEGSYTKAYSMVGKAALKVEDYLSSSLNLFSIKTAATWYAQWLPTLKTTISVGAKARLNDNIKTSVNFGEGVVSKNYSINKYSAFTSASLILPTTDSFTLSLNYNGNFAKKEQTHTAYLQASFNW